VTVFIHTHLIVVHFAIALLSLASIGYWTYSFTPHDKLLFATDLALVIGTIAAIFALLSGAFALHYFDLHHPTQIYWLGLHRFWALITVYLYAITLIWRSYHILLKQPVTWPIRGLVLGGVITLILTGYYVQFLL